MLIAARVYADGSEEYLVALVLLVAVAGRSHVQSGPQGVSVALVATTGFSVRAALTCESASKETGVRDVFKLQPIRVGSYCFFQQLG